jgi:nucleotide-binding universal stress UspA family protein
MKILLAVDGSDQALQAVRYVAKHLAQFGSQPRITLLHVDMALPNAVTTRLGAADVAAYHDENGTEALRKAKRELERAKIAFRTRILVGHAAETIVKQAKKGRFDMIVMGSHGYGSFKALILGSVVTRVLARAQTPTLVVR